MKRYACHRSLERRLSVERRPSRNRPAEKTGVNSALGIAPKRRISSRKPQ